MKIASRRVFVREDKEVVTFLSVESTFLNVKTEAVIKIRETDENKEEVFSVDILDPPAYFRWMAEQKIGTKESAWKDMGAADGSIQQIELPAREAQFLESRRALLDSAAGNLGIPKRLLDPPRG